MRKVLYLSAIMLVAAAVVLLTTDRCADARGNGNPHPAKVVYVTGQQLFYDTIVGPDLPPNGPFQQLEMAGPTGLQTEFGPGDDGYLGGRWWVDANGNGEQDEGDDYFSCPLLGPGREAP